MNDNVLHDLLLENFKKVHEELSAIRGFMKRIDGEILASRDRDVDLMRDVSNIYHRLSEIDVDVARIKQRLELHDPQH